MPLVSRSELDRDRIRRLRTTKVVLDATSVLEVSLALRRMRQEAAIYAGFASPD